MARCAFGWQRPKSPACRARDVAQSIEAREREGRAWDLWQDYGIDPAGIQASRIYAERLAHRFLRTPR